MKNKIVKLFVFSILCSNFLFSQSEKYNKLIPFINKVLQDNHCTGLSIAIIEKEKIVWQHGFGYANIEQKDSVTNETMFQACSISKTPVSFLMMQLAERGELDLDTDVNTYLKNWQVDYSKYKPRANDQGVTIRRIISHTAGLNLHGFEGYDFKDKLPSTLEILNGDIPAKNPRVGLRDMPGFDFHYSGGGFCILQELLEEKYNQKFEILMRENLLTPLKMFHTTYGQNLGESLESKAATNYEIRYKSLKNKYLKHPEQAAAGLWTTPSDLALFIIEIQKAMKGKSLLLKKESAQLFKTAISYNTYLHSDVGPGFFINQYKSMPTFLGHGGGNEGFTAEILFSPLGTYGVVIMMNSSSTKNITALIIKTLNKEYWK